MDEIFSKFKQQFSWCHINDLIVFSKAFEDHLVHLRKVFERLCQQVHLHEGDDGVPWAYALYRARSRRCKIALALLPEGNCKAFSDLQTTTTIRVERQAGIGISRDKGDSDQFSCPCLS
ncbi:hypothetical protein QOT17_015339 [Balamuthia mandrillaris]